MKNKKIITVLLLVIIGVVIIGIYFTKNPVSGEKNQPEVQLQQTKPDESQQADTEKADTVMIPAFTILVNCNLFLNLSESDSTIYACNFTFLEKPAETEICFFWSNLCSLCNFSNRENFAHDTALSSISTPKKHDVRILFLSLNGNLFSP